MTLVVDPFISIKMKYCQLMHYYNYTNSAKPTHKVLFSLSVFSTSLIKILFCWHCFQDPCWQAWTNKLCWWTEASVTGCTANGVYWKFKTNRFCYNWVHTALIYHFFLLEKSLKLPLEQNAWSVVCPWSIFLWKIIFLHIK